MQPQKLYQLEKIMSGRQFLHPCAKDAPSSSQGLFSSFLTCSPDDLLPGNQNAVPQTAFYQKLWPFENCDLKLPQKSDADLRMHSIQTPQGSSIFWANYFWRKVFTCL